MTCQQCGTPMAYGVRFCQRCGRTATPPPAPTLTAAPRRGRTPLVLAVLFSGSLVVCMCAGIAGAAGVAIMASRNDPKTTQQGTTRAAPFAATQYVSTDGGYKISYPTSWKLTEDTADNEYYIQAVSENGNEGIEMTSARLSGSLTIQQAMENKQAALAKKLTDPTFSSSDSRLGGVAAKELKTLFTNKSGTRMEMRQVFAIRDGRIYIFTATAIASEYSGQQAWFDQIKGSIEFTPATY